MIIVILRSAVHTLPCGLRQNQHAWQRHYWYVARPYALVQTTAWVGRERCRHKGSRCISRNHSVITLGSPEYACVPLFCFSPRTTYADLPLPLTLAWDVLVQSQDGAQTALSSAREASLLRGFALPPLHTPDSFCFSLFFFSQSLTSYTRTAKVD